MKFKVDYEKYKQLTDYSNLIEDKKLTISPRELVCVYCTNICCDNKNKAYSCKDTSCPLWPIKKVSMAKAHVLTEEQVERFRKQLIINRSKAND